VIGDRTDLDQGIVTDNGCLTPLSLKNLNRSLKSELTNIDSLDVGVMNDQFPGGVEARLWRLRLPEFQIERAIQFAEFAFSLDKMCFVHEVDYSTLPAIQP
jgi:hypothetical protein